MIQPTSQPAASNTIRRTDPSRPLLALAIALMILNLVILWVSAAPAAQGQIGAAPRSEPEGQLFNATEQRRRMIEQLTALSERVNQVNDRLGRIEQKLEKGLEVKVTEMPKVEIKGGGNN
jgi:Flp pilus assembly protein TadB